MTFWQGKKVFITGHTGFKGSWLSLLLQFLKAEIVGFSLPPPTTPNLFTLASVENGMTSVIGDISNFELLHQTLKQYRPDIVFHMAAQPLVRYSYRNPLETYTTNVMGTVNLLEAIRQSETVKTVVNITTDKCYENKEIQSGYNETDRLGGHDPYSNSKACSELVTEAYRNSYFLDINIGLATARAGNVIGGGDWAEDRLIPDIIRACLNQHSVSIRNPKAIRPWQHVLEPLSGYLLLAERLHTSPSEYAEGWNFGPNEDDTKPVSWIVEYITERLKNSKHWTKDNSQHPHETSYLRLDCTKAKSRLDWNPKWDLERGLEETIHWYQAYQTSKNMREITLAQIKRFINPNSSPRELQNEDSTIYARPIW